MKKIFKILSLLIIMFVTKDLVFAQGTLPYNVEKDILMQKMALEKDIKEKFSSAVGTVLEKNEFVIEVKVLLKNNQQTLFPVLGKSKKRRKDTLFIEKFDLTTPLEIIDKRGSIEARLDTIDLEILIDKETRPIKIRMVKALVKRLSRPVLGVEPVITYTSMPIIAPPLPKIKPKEMTWLERLKEWLVTLKNPIGLMFASILLFILGWLLVSRLLAFGNRFLTTLKEVFNPEIEESFEDMDESISDDVQDDLDSGELVLAGYNKFLELLENNADEALLLVRRWLSIKMDGSEEALTIIVRQSTTQQLIYLFENTTLEERKEWKHMLLTNLSLNKLRKGDNFIESQILDDHLLPPPALDSETKKILSEMTPEECANVAHEDMEIGAILLNVLPAGFIVRVYEHLDAEDIEMLADYGMRYTESLLEEKKTRLKDLLMEHHIPEENIKAPFLEKITDLIPVVSSTSERALFHSLMNNNQIHLLKETAHKYFPSELLENLPNEILRTSFLKYPTKRKIEFLLSRDEEQRNFYLDILGDETSKVRELLDVDLSTGLEDEFIMQKMQENSDQIWVDFIAFMRTQLRHDINAKDDMERVINEWIQTTVNLDDNDHDHDSGAAA